MAMASDRMDIGSSLPRLDLLRLVRQLQEQVSVARFPGRAPAGEVHAAQFFQCCEHMVSPGNEMICHQGWIAFLYDLIAFRPLLSAVKPTCFFAADLPSNGFPNRVDRSTFRVFGGMRQPSCAATGYVAVLKCFPLANPS
jgi:hypothetical protein